MLRRLITFWNAGSGLGLSDPDAIAFYTAITENGGTLSRDERKAVDKLTTDLKTENLWNKIVALYPFIGGSAISHSYNLKNPSKFQITWNGNVTHNELGIITDGTTGYGNTHLPCASVATGALPPVNLTGQPYMHSAVYIQNVTQANNTIGFALGSNYRLLNYGQTYGVSFLFSTKTDGTKGVDANGQDALSSERVPGHNGFFTVTSNINEVTGSSVQPYAGRVRVYKNFDLEVTKNLNWFTSSFSGAPYGSQGSAGNPNYEDGSIFIGAAHYVDQTTGGSLSNLRADYFLAANINLVSFGSFLVEAEVSTFNSIVQEFQTTLGRNV